MAEPGEPAAGAGEAATEVPRFSDEEREALGGMEFAVCVGRFYSELAERLANGAIEGFSEGGVSPASVHTYGVPGAFELPLAAKLCAESGRFAGIACLGAVIRGETGVPCAFGVITCDSMEQALARSGGDKRDQGHGAALTAMRMALLRRSLA
jgi:6,7-dimethyl-8-ribityllumazine synthase